MSRRAPVLVAVVASAVAAGLISAPAALARSPLCQSRMGQTLIQNRSLRVLQTVIPVKGDPDASTLRVYQCAIGKRTATVVLKRHSNLDNEFTVEGASLGGTRWIALRVDIEEGEGSEDAVIEVDAKTAKGMFAYGVRDQEIVSYGVGRDGGVAVLTSGGSAFAFDGTGRRTLAAIGPVDATGPTDLAVAGNTVYWTALGVPASAMLVGHSTGNVEDGD